ncbi:MAG: amidase family protein [Pseudomonadota bacterium]
MLSRRSFTNAAAAGALMTVAPKFGRAERPAGVELLMEHDGIGLAGLVRSGQVSPRELIEASIGAIEALDGEINAIPIRDFDRALDRASSIRPQGPFPGVPFSIKDTANVAGLASPTGGRFYASRVPLHSSGLVRLYEAAGLIVLGKTNVPEYNLIPSTEGSLFGPTRNPWNLDYSSGGSSGGAAACVAAGYMPLAHGTDGAGSIRIPGSHCSVFAFKPGSDRVLPANSQPRFSYDHVLSRTVRDSALSLAVTQDRSPAIALPRLDFVRGPSNRRLRIGFYLDGYAVPPTPEVAEAVEATARLCESLGHEVIETRQPIERDRFEEAYNKLFARNFEALISLIEESTGQPIRDSGMMNRFTIDFTDAAGDIGPEALAEADAFLVNLSRQYRSWMTPFDVVLSPVTYAPPPEIGFLFDNEVEWDIMSRRVFDYVCYTSPMNAFGLPGMSVPLAWSAEGFPIGSHFFAEYGQEQMLLELAYELEAARPWKDTWAPHSIASL